MGMKTQDDRHDSELVMLANNGDEKAMEALYFRYRGYVYALAFRIVGNREDASDVLQDVFAYFFRKFPGFEMKSRIKTFLYPVVKNISIDHIRKRRNVIPLDGMAETIPDEAYSASDEAKKIAEWIEGLPKEDRELLFMRFYDGFKLKEMADILAMPVGTMKSRLHRTLSRLRKMLGILIWMFWPRLLPYM